VTKWEQTGDSREDRAGLAVAASTVPKILHSAGIDPAPRRSGPTWRQSLHAQAAGIIAAGFLHVNTRSGDRDPLTPASGKKA
jgi:hypothetical protein